MKVAILLLWSYAILAAREVLGSPLQPIQAPLDIITLDDITLEDRKEIAYLEERLGRPKRSGKGSAKGSGDILGTIVGAIGKGLTKKVGEIALASVGASGQFSKGSASASSGGSQTRGYSYHHEYEEYPHETHDTKPSVDIWSLKKGILNTLLQAVKAIKGGVIAIKGQLIKGSGKLTSATGNLISVKGDAITNLGKKIITSAVLVNKEHPTAPEHIEYGPPGSHYSAPSAPEEIYHASPSAPAHDYHVPHQYPSHPDIHIPHKGIQGLLVLKKIPGSNYHHHAEEPRAPNFKPIEPTGPSYSSIFSKFFSASTNLDHQKPEPFGHTAVAEVPNTYYQNDAQHNDDPPSASAYIDHDHHHIEEEKPTGASEGFGIPFEKAPEYLNEHFDDYSVSASQNTPQAVKSHGNSSKTNSNKNKQPSKNSVLHNYKFVQKPKSYLPKPSTTTKNIVQNSVKESNVRNIPTSEVFNESLNPNSGQSFPQIYPSLSTSQNMDSQNVHFINPTSISQSTSPNSPKPSATSGQSSDLNNFQFPIFPAISIEDSANYVSNINLPNIDDYPEGFPLPSGQIAQDQTANSQLSEYLKVPSPYSSSQSIDTFFEQELPSPEASSFQQPISSPSPYLETPKKKFFLPTPMQLKPSAQPDGLSYYSTNNNPQKQHGSGKKSPTIKTAHKPHSNPYDLVRSISYELGPNGPKRLT